MRLDSSRILDLVRHIVTAVAMMAAGLFVAGCGFSETVVIVTPAPSPVMVRIAGDSMLPAYKPGELVKVDPAPYRNAPPARGDVIVYRPPAAVGATGLFVGRIIGLPGDTVEVKNDAVYLNGKALREPYIAQPPTYVMQPLHVPQNAFVVLGDNRNNSDDSHLWGSLPAQDIRGRVISP